MMLWSFLNMCMMQAGGAPSASGNSMPESHIVCMERMDQRADERGIHPITTQAHSGTGNEHSSMVLEGGTMRDNNTPGGPSSAAQVS